jgi:hypothetical protein
LIIEKYRERCDLDEERHTMRGDEQDDDGAGNRERHLALWQSELRRRGMKAWCSARESAANNDPIQEPNLRRLNRSARPEVGDLLAIGSVD